VRKLISYPNVYLGTDVNHMGEETQRLAREIIRETDKLGKVANPRSGNGRPQAQQDSLAGPHGDVGRHTNGSHHNEYNGCCTGISVLTAGTPTGRPLGAGSNSCDGDQRADHGISEDAVPVVQ
jgi:hypothetical protein